MRTVKLIKRTSNLSLTYGGMIWGEDTTRSVIASKRSPELCTDGVIHAYKSIPHALLLNPSVGMSHYNQIWEAEAEYIAVQTATKVGVYELTTTRLLYDGKTLPYPTWFMAPGALREGMVYLCDAMIRYTIRIIDIIPFETEGMRSRFREALRKSLSSNWDRYHVAFEEFNELLSVLSERSYRTGYCAVQAAKCFLQYKMDQSAKFVQATWAFNLMSYVGEHLPRPDCAAYSMNRILINAARVAEKSL